MATYTSIISSAWTFEIPYQSIEMLQFEIPVKVNLIHFRNL